CWRVEWRDTHDGECRDSRQPDEPSHGGPLRRVRSGSAGAMPNVAARVSCVYEDIRCRDASDDCDERAAATPWGHFAGGLDRRDCPNDPPGMGEAADYLPATDMPRFIREMMEFVELTDRDVTAIRGSAPIVLRHAESLTAALYDRFLALPRSARFFLREDGSVDGERLERRQHSLARWLRETAEAAGSSQFSYSLLSL